MSTYSARQVSHQLALAIQLNDDATLANFCWGENTLLQQQLLSALNSGPDRLIYLWGPPGSGKSHLLQACCQIVEAHQTTSYLPLKALNEWGPDVLEGIENHTLICIDDIDVIANDARWEEALFHFYNRIRDQEQSVLIISGQLPPANLTIRLPDLRTRLGWGLVAQLHELDDTDKINTLQLHANKRGFELTTSVAQFLLNPCARNMHDLHTLLNRLDEASLIAQRKVTIPFVKETLGI